MRQSGKLVHKLFTRVGRWRRMRAIEDRIIGLAYAVSRSWQRTARALFPALQIRLSRVLQRSSFEKVRRRRATDRVSARAGHHAADHVAPAGKKLQHRAGTLAQKHSRADICSERSDEFGRGAQAPF